MQYLKRLSQVVLAVGGLSCGLLAWADGTDSGTTVTNGVTMDFTVAAVPQTATTNVSFVVDRKLRLDVGTNQSDWVNAVAGQASTTGASIQFLVENNSNDSVDVVIALIDQSNIDVTGFPSSAGPAPIVPTGLTIWEDTNGDGVLDGGETVLGAAAGDFALTGTLLEDEIRTISVSIDVAGAATADLYQTYGLVAAVASAGTAIANDDSSNESPGVADVPAVADDPLTVQVVFADDGSANAEDQGYDFLAGAPAPTGLPDALTDGQAANAAGFRTIGVLGIAKYVEVIYDPISGNHYTGVGNGTTGTEPKAIPGAIIMYVIGVSNQSSLAATGVAISDNVPGGQPGDPLLLGNSAAVAGVAVPASVDIDIDGSIVTFDLDTSGTGIAVDSQVHVRECSTTSTDPLDSQVPFGADPAEVNAIGMGASCDSGSTGYIVYFTTVDDAAS